MELNKIFSYIDKIINELHYKYNTWVDIHVKRLLLLLITIVLLVQKITLLSLSLITSEKKIVQLSFNQQVA